MKWKIDKNANHRWVIKRKDLHLELKKKGIWPKETASDSIFASKTFFYTPCLSFFWISEHTKRNSAFLEIPLTGITLHLHCISTFFTAKQCFFQHKAFVSQAVPSNFRGLERQQNWIFTDNSSWGKSQRVQRKMLKSETFLFFFVKYLNSLCATFAIQNLPNTTEVVWITLCQAYRPLLFFSVDSFYKILWFLKLSRAAEWRTKYVKNKCR